MAPRKPNSSYASNRLTKNNHPGTSLLSQVAGRSTRNASRKIKENENDSSDDPLSAPETNALKAEPATEDDPLPTTDEEHDDDQSEISNEPFRRTTWSARDLAEVRAEADREPRKSSESPTKKRKVKAATVQSPTKTRQTTREGRRSRKDGNNKNNNSPRKVKSEENTQLFSSLSFSHNLTRNRKYGSYGNRPKNIHASPTSKERKDSEFKFPSNIHSSDAAGAVHEFQNPPSYPLDDFSNSSIPTSSAIEVQYDLSNLLSDDSDELSSPLSSMSSSFLADVPKMPRMVPCPMCTKPVEAGILESFSSTDKMGVRQQSQFCRMHRKRTAEKEWHERAYPTIDWDSLHKRIENHYTRLERILTQESSSFYREALESARVEGDKKAALRLTIHSKELDRMSSGYYGARGARYMMEGIISHFAPKIRELAPTDSLMQATGVSRYVQSVLVPEMTVMLVKEDMNVDDAEARRIMKESMEIGDLLNEQLDDKVTVDEEEIKKELSAN